MEMIQDTLSILKRGHYILKGKKIKLKLSKKEMAGIQVYLPEDIKKISEDKNFRHAHVIGRIGIGCENTDSFSLARKRGEGKPGTVLVLNFANPFNPGGGVRRGAKAQEEDLCRKSSLLLSLESREANKYYDYHRSLHTNMASDAIMISPQVEIIKDENGNLLEDSVIVAVMTCAAPMLLYGLEGMTNQQYQEMLLGRIMGMLKLAAYLGYKVLVLGAFGCGAFKNDARVVSDLFYEALKEFDYDGMAAGDFFRRIDFAVMDHSADQYNFKEFSRNFSDFYRDENAAEIEQTLDKIKQAETHLDRIRGSMIGGAVGDALGYAVEFWQEEQIFKIYGSKGITEYERDKAVGKALISDDTQMTLFTANGILVGQTRTAIRGIGASPADYVAMAYQDWLKTQQFTMDRINSYDRCTREGGFSWLLDVPELYSRRAPGNSCLSALFAQARGSVYGTLENPCNDSKGCGGIMRVAPLALAYRVGENYFADIGELDKTGAKLSAITHGHSLGYMPAAAVTHIISRILTSYPEMSLKEIVWEARDKMKELFKGDVHLNELIQMIDRAVQLSENDRDDLDNIHALGEGWVAEETLGIALYCALKYQNDFSKGIIVSVNHNGDSDSTGAVTGNILGAIAGYKGIDKKWKEHLELADVILEMADDLCHGCQMSEYSCYRDEAWMSKYIHMHRYAANKCNRSDGRI